MNGKKIMSISLAAIAVVILLALFLGLRNSGISPYVVTLNSDWNISINGASEKVSDLSSYKLARKVIPGDSLVFERTLEDSLCKHPVLRFKTYHSRIEVVAGDEVVYSFGRDYEGDGFVGSGFHYAFLNSKSLGKNLKVTIVPTEKDAFSVMPVFDVLPENNALTDYSANHMLTTLVGVFLVLFGIISVISSLCLSFFGTKHYRFLMIGLLALLMGLWSLCYMMLLQIFSVDLAFNTNIEFVTLYLAPLPLCLFLLDMRKGSIGKKKTFGVICLMAFDAFFFLVATLLHVFDVAHYVEMLNIFHLYVLVGFVYLATFVVGYRRSADLSGRLISWGVVIFAVIAVLDLLRYNVYRSYLVQFKVLEDTWIPAGILIFVLFLLASYLVYLFKIISDKAEKDLLAAMVYVDSLTGLFNRAKCQQIFEILDKSSADYAVVSIDMNGLKFVNDKYGHSTGDELLKAFADVFKQAFVGVGTTIRMGGDEFLCIVRNEHLGDIKDALQRMGMLQKACAVELPIPLEVAYGVAYRSECGNGCANSEEVYRVADEKMYAMKASMKSSLVRR